MTGPDLPQPDLVVVTMADAVAVLTDPRFGSSALRRGARGIGHDTPAAGDNLLGTDGPAHERLRRLVVPHLRLSTGWSAATVEDRLRTRLDALEPDQPVEMVAQVLRPLVVDFVTEAVGLPVTATPVVAEVVGAMDGSLEPDTGTPAARAAVVRALTGLRRLLRDPAVDGLAGTLREAEAAGTLSGRTAVLTLAVVLHGGYENPLNALGLLLVERARRADALRQALSRDPAAAVDGLLSATNPVRGVARWAQDAVPEWGLATGDAVWVDLEAVHAGDVTAGRPRHLAFGHGPHRCPGAPLSRALLLGVATVLLDAPDSCFGELRATAHRGVVAQGVSEAWLPRPPTRSAAP